MIAPVLLKAPTEADPAHTEAILRLAPTFLQAQRKIFNLPYPLSLLLDNESQEKWASYENILLASLTTGDYGVAKQCIAALTERFGKLNERVLILQGMYDEAVARDAKELALVLKKYDDIIAESPTMFGVRKRRVALLKSLGRLTEAVSSLIEVIDNSPTDAEAWAELADLYISQGNLERAVFCLEEVLLIMPNAWNMQAKLGEVLYLSANAVESSERVRLLSESVRRFCRSAELCNTYLRAYYGLKMATSSLLSTSSDKSDKQSRDTSIVAAPVLSQMNVQKLNQLAISKLAEITRNNKTGDQQWDGYDITELTAAQTLLAQTDNKQAR